MRLHVGVDEAGLGPTLGPLVIAAFLVRLDGRKRSLSQRLAPLVGPPATKAVHLEVGDSKAIYSGTSKLARLERSVLATYVWLHKTLPATTQQLLHSCTTFSAPLPSVAWYPHADEYTSIPLPLAANRDEILELGQRLRMQAEANGIECASYHARVITEAQLNRETKIEAQGGGTKNTWTTHHSLDHAFTLARSALSAHPSQQIEFSFDRAGGRADYRHAIARALTQHQWGLALHREEREPQSTHYEYATASDAADAGPLFSRPPIAANHQVKLAFRVGAESLDPTVGWASMLAKYVREITMLAFNRYWSQRAPDVRPTAGYPEDARRFLNDVAHVQSESLPPEQWVRQL